MKCNVGLQLFVPQKEENSNERVSFSFLKLVVIMFVLIACSDKNETNDSTKRFHKSQFQQGVLYSQAEFESLLKQNLSKTGSPNTIARTMQMAGVGLVFDEAGYLFTPDEFNQEVESITVSTDNDTSSVSTGDQMMDVYYTDLNTYSEVTLDPNATEENTTGIASLDSNGEFVSPYYVFDIYRTSYLSKETQMQKLKKEASSFLQKGIAQIGGTPNPPAGIVGVGDVVIADGKKSKFGHAGVVVAVGYGNSLQGAWMMEAVGDRPHHKEDEVVLRTSDKYFFKGDLNYMKICYRENITYQQRDAIRAYVVAQDPDPYSIWTSKDSGGKWYCSKLPWRAYKKKVGCSIDEDGGFWVTPFDIAGDASLKGSYYWSN
jgi:hypothetical protein